MDQHQDHAPLYQTVYVDFLTRCEEYDLGLPCSDLFETAISGDMIKLSDCTGECGGDAELDECDNCMSMECCDFTDSVNGCSVGSYTPSYENVNVIWTLTNGNKITSNPCADIWGNNFIPGNSAWNNGCLSISTKLLLANSFACILIKLIFFVS